ncbi:putative glycoside hydrolase, partial [bacterium]|nr:putative glycoside hydrolase [bacterium]
PWNGSPRQGVWVSHAIKGVFAIDADARTAAAKAGAGTGAAVSAAAGGAQPGAATGWTPMNAGLPKVFNTNFEEVSDFALIPTGTGAESAAAGGAGWAFLAGLSYKGTILQWDPAARAFSERYAAGADFDTVESLSADGRDAGYAISGGMAQRFFLPSGAGKIMLRPDAWLTGAAKAVSRALASQCGDRALCLAWIPPPAGQSAPRAGSAPVVLKELGLLGGEDGEGDDPAALRRALARRALADGKDGLYLQTGFAVNKAAREKYLALATSLGLNSIVLDMKDDSGKLRFSPLSPALAGMDNGGEALDIEGFAEEAHRRGMYLIARIVVFKDEALYRRDGGALALRDAASGLPWRGLRQDGQPNQEFWVDPYSPEVWRYNVEIAREVTSRGFDEVQFDYIRFPTDGTNLASARFPASVAGMSQEAVLESFLRYARKNLSAPIGVDIYGYNGWYRTGAGTGQNLEMLAKYVDVVSPMFYPSHFEQGFQAQAPAELRPYRIYKLGTLRASAIARGKVLIRPYVQAFYLDVSYDQAYYGKKYVAQEIRGVREGADQGMTFWNNVGRYDDLVGTYLPPQR